MKGHLGKSFSWPIILAFRFARQHLSRAASGNLVEVCGNVCGIQAQLTSAAEIALWARVRGLRRIQIEAALWKDRSLVKSSFMRQTIHWIPASDFSLYTAALRTRNREAFFRIMSRFGLTARDYDSFNESVLNALRSGPLTKTVLTQRIYQQAGKRLQAWMKRIWNPFKPALAEGLICYSSERGNEVCFVRAGDWLPKQKKVAEIEARQILLRRYLRSYGPATRHDFSKWSGLSMKEAQIVWDSLQDEFQEISVAGEQAAILRKDIAELRDARPATLTLRLLPSFDPYLLAHAEKIHLVDTRHYKRVYHPAAWISPVVLRDGRAIGVWSISRGASHACCAVEFFAKQPNTIRAEIAEEILSLERFLKISLKVSFT
ncbi:MAG: winged helix DNA-binding domain-containing protein [Candidatus Acidiferrales bacterium]